MADLEPTISAARGEVKRYRDRVKVALSAGQEFTACVDGTPIEGLTFTVPAGMEIAAFAVSVSGVATSV